jgi:asparagine synthase (glutamine-hydrolysing)
MCGICGVISRAPVTATDQTNVDRMNAALVHRGPDSAGTFTHGHVAMAMRRLSIIDLAGGQQPLFNEDQTIALVANGEIYNFVELRRELEARGHRFATHSDCETIIHAYEEYGDAFVEKLRGMFAFCLHDTVRGRAIIARDRLGEKPVYLLRTDNTLAFSSELKSLVKMADAPARRLRPESIDLFYHFEYLPEPVTMMEGIVKLPRATMLVVDTKTFAIEERLYWRMNEAPPSTEPPTDLIRRTLDELAHIIIRSDVPVGVELSGGIDSSLVAVLAQRYSQAPVHAFTVGYPGYPVNDERKHALALSESLSLVFHDIEVTKDELIRDFDAMIHGLDDPNADIASYGHYRIAQAARAANVPVLLAGFGGDELFWGYHTARDSVPVNRRRRGGTVSRARLAASLFRRFRKMEQNRPAWAARQAVRAAFGDDYVFYELKSAYLKSMSQRDDAFTSDFLGRVGPDNARNVYAHPDDADPEIASCGLLFDLWMAGNSIPLGDRMTMAHSIEMRLPLIDHILVERVLAARRANPGDYALYPKRWLIDATADLLPTDITTRRKLGFTPPMVEWIGALVADRREQILNGYLATNGILRRSFLETAVGDVVTYRQFLYKTIVLESWIAHYA